MKRLAVLTAALVIVITDRLTKDAAIVLLSGGRNIEVIPGIFRLSLVMNRGAAFGLLKNQANLFIAVSAAVILSVLIYLFRKPVIDIFSSVALSFILGGAAGNLWDRLLIGRVIDFLDFRIWPVFNVADSAITVGVVFLILKFLCIRSSRR